jgi:ribosome biogenesis protein BRX1
MDELRLTGNCLKGSRPLLSFDKGFDSEPHLKLLKEMFIQIFNVPRGHPKSQPFHDHVLGFYLAEGKVWVRHYQILDATQSARERGKMAAKGEEPSNLVEIGPRFVLEIVRVFAGSFRGATLWANPEYVSPNRLRHAAKEAIAASRGARSSARAAAFDRSHHTLVLPVPEMAKVFTAAGAGAGAGTGAGVGAGESDEGVVEWATLGMGGAILD